MRASNGAGVVHCSMRIVHCNDCMHQCTCTVGAQQCSHASDLLVAGTGWCVEFTVYCMLLPFPFTWVVLLAVFQGEQTVRVRSGVVCVALLSLALASLAGNATGTLVRSLLHASCFA
jgi:hypothetical protein